MALIVETGAGISGANSYLSVADADAYHADRTADAAWTGASTADKEKALRLATQYIEVRYAGNFMGSRTFLSRQPLSFPRTGVEVDSVLLLSNVLPQQLKDATAELALRSVKGDNLLPDLAADTGPVTSSSVSVGQGAVSESVTYSGPRREVKKYGIIDRLLSIISYGGRFIERG